MLHLRPHIRSAMRLGIPTLVVCAGLLTPVTASGGTRHESSTGAPSASTATPEPTTDLEASVSPFVESSAESNADTSSEARRGLREERRARRAGRSSAGCSVNLQAPAPITAGDAVSLLGSLSCAEAASAAGQTVTVYQNAAHASGFVLAGTTTTEADGSFRFTPSGLDTNTVFYAISDGSKSERVRVMVTPVVVLTAPAAGMRLFTGATRVQADASVSNAVTFTGTISPTGTGAVVALQRQDGSDGRWHHIGVGRVGDEGTYSITHTFHKPGNANIRVVAHFPGLHMSAASAPAAYEITRRQHEQLTIQASADTISYEQPVTISGTVARAVDQPVTLLAQTSAITFEPVAQNMTNESGEYTFTESPLQNTRYRVISGDARSVVLSEDVAYALTAEPSALTVEAGRQLTFSGNMTPAHAGQVVHLERQNPSGVGFHVVAYATVGPDASYSIEFTFGSARTERMRITVPGDGQNCATVSEPFSIQVTAASGADTPHPESGS